MNKAERKNLGKPQLSLIDLSCLSDCAKVLEFGAKKYSRDNWKKGMDLSSILDSLLRHISLLQSGEYTDLESGLSHIGHIQCNALFLGCKNNTNNLTTTELHEDKSQPLTYKFIPYNIQDPTDNSTRHVFNEDGGVNEG